MRSHGFRGFSLLFLALLLLGLAGCGRMGDPIPPGMARLNPPSTPLLVGRDGALTLSWSAPGRTKAGAIAEGLRGYVVERTQLEPGEEACETCPSSPPTLETTKTTSWTDTRVNPGFSYRYRVWGIDHRDREGLPSPFVYAKWFMPPTPPKFTAEGIHLGVRLHIGDVPSQNPPPLGFAVYSSEGKLLQRIPPGVKEAVISGLPNDEPARLVFRWEVDTGEGWIAESLPVPLTVIPHDVDPPEPPSAIAIFTEDNGIFLHWMGAVGEPAETFVVERAGQDENFDPLTTIKGTTLQFLDKTVAPGVTYLYRVISVDLAGNRSLPSPVAKAKAAGR